MFGSVSIEFYNIIILEYALLLLYIFKASFRIYIRLYRQARMVKGFGDELLSRYSDTHLTNLLQN